MRLAADKRLPAVLLTPVWNTQIRGDYLQRFVVGRLPVLQKYEHLIPLFGPLLILWAQHFTGFQVYDQVQPKTIILHSPEDELFDIRQSVKLLANSPLPEGSADTTFMKSVIETLAQRRYSTDGRLVKVGADHQMDDPEVLRALVDAVSLLCGAGNATEHEQTDG